MNIGTIERRIGNYEIDEELKRVKSRLESGIVSEGTRIDAYKTIDKHGSVFNVVFYQSGMEREIRELLGINPDELKNGFGYTREAPGIFDNVEYRFVLDVRQCNDLRRVGRKPKKEYFMNIFSAGNNSDDQKRILGLLKLFIDMASDGI